MKITIEGKAGSGKTTVAAEIKKMLVERFNATVIRTGDDSTSEEMQLRAADPAYQQRLVDAVKGRGLAVELVERNAPSVGIEKSHD